MPQYSFHCIYLVWGLLRQLGIWVYIFHHIWKKIRHYSFFKNFIYFLLKDNCFTEFCCFLSNINMTQPQVYIYPLPFEPPYHPPPHLTPLDWYRAPVWVSWAIQQTPVGYLFYINPIDGGAWWATVHGVPQSRTRLSDFTFTFYFHALEKEMATRSSVLALRIPGTGEPGGLLSMGLHRVGHD